VSESLELMKKYTENGRYAIVELKSGSKDGALVARVERSHGEAIDGQQSLYVPLIDAEDVSFAEAALTLRRD